MKSRIMLHFVIYILTLWNVSGCAFFTIPEEVSLKYSFAEDEQFFWEYASLKEDLPSFDTLGSAVGDFWFDQEDYYPSSNMLPVASFLHLSDPQIRDERIYNEDWFDDLQLRAVGYVVSSARRDPFIDSFDSLNLASFLLAYGKRMSLRNAQRKSLRPFVIITGDLLDISLATELMEVRKVLYAVFQSEDFQKNGIEVKLAAGNHDGLVFGNFTDRRTKTRSLGINKSEFIMGLLLDTKQGYGFAGNEVIKLIEYKIEVDGSNIKDDNLQKDFCPECIRSYERSFTTNIKENINNLHEALFRINLFRKGHIAANELKHSLAFRKLIKIPGDSEHAGLKLGYYSWVDPVKHNIVTGIRYVVLDTRSNWKDDWWNLRQDLGVMDLVQLGWLYKEMSEAYRKKQAVVIFAHHSPFKLLKPHHHTTRIFKRILESFPNIIGYFYGHEHWNGNSPWKNKKYNFQMIQTGSLVDYPQRGRTVDIYLRDLSREERDHRKNNSSKAITAVIRSKYTRPYDGIDQQNTNNILLKSILANNLHLAKYGGDKKARKLWTEEKGRLGKNLIDLYVVLDFSKAVPPSSESIFGKRILKKVECMRQYIFGRQDAN